MKYTILAVSMASISATLAFANTGEKTKELFGKDGETIVVTYSTRAGAGYPPALLGVVNRIQFQCDHQIVYTSSPISATFVAATAGKSSQLTVIMPCQYRYEIKKTICETRIGDTMEFDLETWRTGFPGDVNLTVVFQGKPVIDSFDGKSYFVLNSLTQQ